MNGVQMITTADFFTPYSDQFGNIDVNWDVLISMKINKFLSATLNTTLKYDNDLSTIIPTDLVLVKSNREGGER